jgi:hypothetical protein
MGINRIFGLFVSAALAAVATMVLMVSVIVESFTPVRLGAVLAVLILLHSLWHPRLLFCRESALYAAFVGYMFLSLLWAPDADLGMNTLVPAVDFLLILILFGSLITYHDSAAVLAGTLGGFLTGAAIYTHEEGFPFVWPVDFSYNSIAGMYLFGLLVTLIVGWHMRWRIFPIAVGSILLLLIAATTSIKTNLGVLLGAAGAALIYLRHFLAVVRRTAIVLVVMGGVIGYAVATNDTLIDRLEDAFDRVSLGVGVLTAREDADVRGEGLGLQTRVNWKGQGIRGWLTSPVLGLGVEGFRADYGITSHSTPVDLLYNFGVIGLTLFYALFASITWRLWRARGAGLEGLCALILGGLVCYVFMSMAGTLYYNAFIAAFVAIGIALLRQHTDGVRPSEAFPRDSDA